MAGKHDQAERMRHDVPSTIARSDDKAVRTYKKALQSAEQTYGEGERAHRAAYAALKHTHEKVGDHWEPKERSGPSDSQAEQGTPEAVRDEFPTAGGVNANAPKAHLADVARRLGIANPQRRTKRDLITEIENANSRQTREARKED